MALNLIQTLAHKDGMATLPKVDPNTQEISAAAQTFTDKLCQAAIPATLVGLYKYTRDEKKAANIVSSDFKNNWRQEIFGDSNEMLVSKVADYAGVPVNEATAKLDDIFNDTIQAIREKFNNITNIAIKNLFTEQRTNILSHLPAALGIGELLDDDSLDDRTNKMKGPVTNLMHTIEKTFAGTEGTENSKKM